MSLLNSNYVNSNSKTANATNYADFIKRKKEFISSNREVRSSSSNDDNDVKSNSDSNENIFTCLQKKQPNIDQDLTGECEVGDVNAQNKTKKRFNSEAINSNSEITVNSIILNKTNDSNKRSRYLNSYCDASVQVNIENTKSNTQTGENEVMDITVKKEKVTQMLDSIDKICLRYASKTVEHRSNASDRVNYYSLNKFTRFKQLITNDQSDKEAQSQKVVSDVAITSSTNVSGNFCDINKAEIHLESTKNVANPNLTTETRDCSLQNMQINDSVNSLKDIKKSLSCNTFKTNDIPPPLPQATTLLNNEIKIPPIPTLRIDSEKRQFGTAVILTWEIPGYDASIHEKIKEYELYGYRENDSEHAFNNTWKLIGTIPPYTPPVKCTLTDFAINSNYHFAIRIRDINQNLTEFSVPCAIRL